MSADTLIHPEVLLEPAFVTPASGHTGSRTPKTCMNLEKSLTTLALLLGTTLTPAAWGAPVAPTPPTVVDVESGGVSTGELEAMRGRLHFYNLRVVTAAKGSGAYLADVEVTIRSLPARTSVVEHRMQGPWLLAWLPPGRYEIEARYAETATADPERQTRTTLVPSKGRRDLVLYFRTGDEVSPDAPALASPPRAP